MRFAFRVAKSLIEFPEFDPGSLESEAPLIEVRIVPKGEVSFEFASEIADRLNWESDDRATRDAQREESEEFVWDSCASKISLIKDYVLHCDYFTVRGAAADSIARSIQGCLSCYSLSEILEIANQATTQDEQISALRLIASAAPANYDGGIFRVVRENGEDSRAPVRLAAVLAASHLRWEQLRPLVERIAGSDPAEALRDFSWNVLHLTQWDRGRSSSE